jgi:hypothetical protein
MNSRQRRKLAAQQHNDAIAYIAWLKANTQDQRVDRRAQLYVRGRRSGLTRLAAIKLMLAAGYGL